MSESQEPLPQQAPEPPFATVGYEPVTSAGSGLFFGDDGLRAGWGILLYIGLVLVIGFLLNSVVSYFHLIPKRPSPQSELPPGAAAIGEALQFVALALPAWIMSVVERRPFSRYGLASKRMLSDLAAGLFWGFCALSALIGMLYAAHAIEFDGFLLSGAETWVYAARWAFVFLCVGLFEEFLFRGYLQYTVSRGVAGIVRAVDPGNRHSHAIGFWGAAFVFSIALFMVAHQGNGGETASGIIAVGLAGTVFAFSLYRTGSLWWGIGMHTAWDWAQSYFYGTADSGAVSQGRLLASHPVGSKFLSGGSDGPEGSIFVIPALLLVALVIHYTLPRRDYYLTPDQAPPLDELAGPATEEAASPI